MTRRAMWVLAAAACAALVVSGAGAVAGTHSRTGQPIKGFCMSTNGTRALTAPRYGKCPRGTVLRTAPVGTRGVPGPRGPAGTADVTVVKADLRLATKGITEGEVLCPTGSSTTGGGYAVRSSSWRMHQNEPLLSP